MPDLTPTQQRILDLLPATPGELAGALYGRVTRSELALVYVHVALLRRRLNRTTRVVSQPIAPRPRSARAEQRNESGANDHANRIMYILKE